MNKRIGIILLAIGILLLITSILFAFAVGGMVVPVLLFLSIIINSAGIMLLRGNKQ